VLAATASTRSGLITSTRQPVTRHLRLVGGEPNIDIATIRDVRIVVSGGQVADPGPSSAATSKDTQSHLGP
jgi:hypothetical protein